MKLSSVFIVVLLCASSVVRASSLCLELASCHQHGDIVIIGDDEAAARLVPDAQIGAQRFERFFGVDAPLVAVVTGGVVTDDTERSIKAAGIANILPWISAADRRKLVEASVRKQVLAQTASLPAEQQEALVQRALASAGTQSGAASSDATSVQRGALTHELGHIWFKAAFAFDSDAAHDGAPRYGGGAPDWLDEVAAILLENQALRSSRRTALLAMAKSDLYPLNEYLTMQHPSLASARKLAAQYETESGSSNRAIVLTGEEAEAFLKESQAGDPAIFYTQTQGFIDFIMSHSADEQIFAEIATALAGGESFAEWLGRQSVLPRSLAELDVAWQDWLDARSMPDVPEALR